jgi:hypothetical protein
MAPKKAGAKASKKRSAAEDRAAGTPAFPYTTQPSALRRLLAEIPKRPKPPKVTLDTLKGWNVSKNNNASTAIGVLKKIGMLNDTGQPLDAYAAFMSSGTGAIALGVKLRETYRILFENSKSPQSTSTEELKTLFNIHSGGGEDAMRLQIQTFKILAEFADFNDAPMPGNVPQAPNLNGAGVQGTPGTPGIPPIQIDLHIHLPENKSTRDYEAIIQDIAKYIYGRELKET